MNTLRQFYILSHDSSSIWHSINDYNLFDFDDLPLLDGNKLKNGFDKNVKLTTNKNGKWPDYLNTPLSWNIVSSELKYVFEIYEPNYAIFFPIKENLKTYDIPNKEYWLMSFFKKNRLYE